MNQTHLRIAMIGPLPPPAGGMAGQTAQLARLLRQEGIVVEEVAVNAPYYPAWIGRVQGVRALFRLFSYVIRLCRIASRVDLFHVMANSGWSWHLFAAPAIWIGSWYGKPVVVNYRGGQAEEFFKRSFNWVRPSLARAAKIIVPSEFLQRVFGRFGVSCEIVPNIVDRSRFYPGTPSVDENRSRSIHVVVARHLERLYDNATAIEAFARIRECYPAARMTVAGTGPERVNLEQLVRKLGLGDAVRFSGNLGRDEMADLLRSADLMLNPSLADNMPNSLLEAMACGVPIVTTDVGGIPLIVKSEETALLVKPGQARDMAEAALRILDDQRLRLKLIQNGLRDADGYSWPRIRELWLNTYAQLCKPFRFVSQREFRRLG
jgi:glycosyltransferase involved in cell wall biosynthesis